MTNPVRFTWHKSIVDDQRVYEVWSVPHKRLLYSGRGYVAARKFYNRALEEAAKLDEYNQRQAAHLMNGSK